MVRWEYEEGITALEIAKDISIDGEALVASVNDETWI